MKQGPYSRILVAVDFSDGARRAFREAVRIGKASGATLTLIHVTKKLEPSLPWNKANRAVVAELARDVKAESREALEAWAAEADGLPVHIKIAVGVPHEQILAEAKRRRADLIVVSARGQTLSDRLLLGSTSERVIRKATRPVLLVPSPPHRH